ncbi:MAG: hypothetical protein K6G47_06960 [Clostridia bacterium]|nr:hypothetical protein [Clostridia bacterium]
MKSTSNSKGRSNVRNAVITGVLLVAAVGAVFTYLNRDKLFADEKKPVIETEVEQKETSASTTALTEEFETTYVTDETEVEVDEDFVKMIEEFDQRSLDAVIMPSDISDPDLKELASYYSGYELIDLSKELYLMEDFDEGFFYNLMENLKPQDKDINGFFCYGGDQDSYWNLLIFKMSEEDLHTYMDGVVRNDILLIDQDVQEDADSLFSMSTDSDGNKVYTWTSGTESSFKTDYEITYDQNTNIVKVFAEASGGVG